MERAVRAKVKRLLRSTNSRLAPWGIDGTRALVTARGSTWVRKDRKEYERQRLASDHPDEFPMGRTYPIYEDRDSDAGVATGHYFHQDLLVAREIFERKPRRHIDVGSAIYGFVSHVASFREIEVLDIRPVHATVPGIKFVQQDLMSTDLTFVECTDSVSCLHALEHFGLGRYNDPIDYDGWRKVLARLTRMLEPQGTLYLGLPTGREQRVEFNAHRVFSLPFLRGELEKDFTVQRLAFVNDAGDLIPDVDPHGADADRSLDSNYGCSIWALQKK